MSRQNNAHRKALEKIAADPKKFGYEGVISLVIEADLYHKRKLIAQPDIFMESINGKNREINIIEYKSNGDERLLDRAKIQLERAVWWVGKYRPDIDPEKIHTQIISGTDQKYKGLFR